MSATTAQPPPTAAAPAERRSARLVTEVLAPPHLVVLVLIVIGTHATGSLAGAGWGLLAGVFCGGLPIVFVVAGVRRGRWSDKHLKIRAQRWIPLFVTLGSVLVGTGLLAALGAPREVVALVAAMIAGLLLTMAVTVWWKVSVHTAVASGVAVVITVAYGWWAALLYLGVAAVGWSRVSLRDHTTGQVVVGAVLGGTAAAAVFAGLR
ncbi:hypothetical protein [Streptomyces sp. NBC_00102]|uniref:hypothetical protein n=1 Tax=Streptomyces sp. NBC_00102 TaxID=2975652 RepID=UPI002253A7FE|nr:hypothetical protein [Streptomyces sp. NBC_00102]MCX5395979.1 hypothetical protein [Streptomyces sp. NBC_00102]